MPETARYRMTVRVPHIDSMPRNTNRGQRDLAFLKFAAELKEQNPEFSRWIEQQTRHILDRRQGARKPQRPGAR